MDELVADRANFHDPERFGHLVLSPTPEQLAALQDELRKGDRSGPLRILGAEGFAGTSYREMAERKVADIDERLEELSRIAADEEDQATQEGLLELIDRNEARLAPIREKVDGEEAMDEAAWTNVDWELNALSAALEEAVWEARLAALLSRL